MGDDTKKLLEEILDSVKNLENRVAHIEVSGMPNKTTAPSQISPIEKKMSIKEFLIKRAPSGGVQTTLAIAYYVETLDGISPFNKKDLEKGFRAAKETVPENINDKTNMCIKNGHVMEAEEKKDKMKAWVLTRSGEQFVSIGFKREKK